MKLSICIVNYYTEEQIKRLLESISLYRPECLHEVIIVDNGDSMQQLKELKEDFGEWIHILSPQQNIGYGAAQNRAAKKAVGEYLLLLNPDIEVEEGSLDRLIHLAETMAPFGVIGPQLIHPDGTLQDSFRRFPRFRDLFSKRLGIDRFFKKSMDHYLMNDKSMNKPTTADWLVGAAMLMKRSTFLEQGGFDERFFLFFEDTDLCRRLKASDLDVWYVPNATFLHSQKRLSERGFWPLSKTFWIHLHSACKYYWKWIGMKEKRRLQKALKKEKEKEITKKTKR